MGLLMHKGKSYGGGLTRLLDMLDVNISNPSNGDGLVHDGNDWKNIPIMTKEQWKKNGAYNLCSNEKLKTQVLNGITVTFNPTGYPKGSVRLQGYVSTGQWIPVNYRTMKLKQNQKYKLCGIIGGHSSTYRLRYYDDAGGSATVYDDDTGEYITEFVCKNPNTSQVDIYVNTGATASNPIDTVIYPMVTTDLTATYRDYVPHAKTNRELTEDVSDISKRFANNFKFLGEIDASQIDNIGSTFFPEINTGSRCYYSFGYVISGTGECWVNGYEYKGGMYGFQIRYLFNGTVMKRYKNNSNTWSSWENV